MFGVFVWTLAQGPKWAVLVGLFELKSLLWLMLSVRVEFPE
jgi:hypothetical protein